MNLTTQIPKILRSEAQQSIDTVLAMLPEAVPSEVEQLDFIFACSPFIATECCRNPELLHRLLSGELYHSRTPLDYQTSALAILQDAEADEERFMSELRRWRRLEMVRIAWRDLAGLALSLIHI